MRAKPDGLPGEPCVSLPAAAASPRCWTARGAFSVGGQSDGVDGPGPAAPAGLGRLRSRVLGTPLAGSRVGGLSLWAMLLALGPGVGAAACIWL
ncbi:MAG: hypothetical protein EXR44_02240 [Dehalococcoidia bacterium]|nr:hypothetical protein [Dehalococcoidia bacterium]